MNLQVFLLFLITTLRYGLLGFTFSMFLDIRIIIFIYSSLLSGLCRTSQVIKIYTQGFLSCSLTLMDTIKRHFSYFSEWDRSNLHNMILLENRIVN